MSPGKTPAGRRWWGAGIALALLAGAAGLALYLRDHASAPATPTVAARVGDFLVTVSLRGSLVAARSQSIHAPNIAALQIAWLAPDGGTVASGAPVARFDSSTARSDLNAKQAALRQAQAALDQAVATARITAQQDALDLATDRNAVASAQLDADKAAILSPIDGDEAKLALAMAKEKLTVEQATIAAHDASSAAKIASAQRNRDKAQADLDRDNQQLAQLQVAAPLTGAVHYLMNYSQGFMGSHPFRVGDTVWPGADLGEIPDLATLEIVAKISEVDRGRVSPGEDLDLHLDALPELTLHGVITSLSALAEVDFGSTWPPPQVFSLDARLDTHDPRLRPGMTGAASVITRRIVHAISVPAAAVFTENGKPVVFVLDGRRFRTQAVGVVARDPDAVAVSGLAAGAKVALEDPRLSGAAAPGADLP